MSHPQIRAQSGMCEASGGDTASLTYGYVMRRKIRFSAVCGLSNFVPIAHQQLMRFREPGLNRAYAMPMMTVSVGSHNTRPNSDIEKVRTSRQEMYVYLEFNLLISWLVIVTYAYDYAVNYVIIGKKSSFGIAPYNNFLMINWRKMMINW